MLTDDVGELGYEFSLALGVVFDVDDDAASSPAMMKKKVKSGCLLDLVNGIYGGSLSLASSSSCSSSAGVGDIACLLQALLLRFAIQR